MRTGTLLSLAAAGLLAACGPLLGAVGRRAEAGGDRPGGRGDEKPASEPVMARTAEVDGPKRFADGMWYRDRQPALLDHAVPLMMLGANPKNKDKPFVWLRPDKSVDWAVFDQAAAAVPAGSYVFLEIEYWPMPLPPGMATPSAFDLQIPISWRSGTGQPLKFDQLMPAQKQQLYNETKRNLVRALKRGKQLSPAAQWGVYGTSVMPSYNASRHGTPAERAKIAEAARYFMQPSDDGTSVADRLDWVGVSLYPVYADKPGMDGWYRCVDDALSAARQLDRPVLAFFQPRWTEATKTTGPNAVNVVQWQYLDETTTKAMTRYLLQRCDGLALFDWDGMSNPEPGRESVAELYGYQAGPPTIAQAIYDSSTRTSTLTFASADPEFFAGWMRDRNLRVLQGPRYLTFKIVGVDNGRRVKVQGDARVAQGKRIAVFHVNWDPNRPHIKALREVIAEFGR